MGKHYIPQNYLEGFSDPGNQELIWMFDKGQPTDKPKHLAIKAVAQSPDFYTPQAEQWLNKEVEMPAQEQLRRLAMGQQIHEVDRFIVAIYIQVMVLRVPHARKILAGMVRDGVADFVEEVKANPDELPADMSKEDYFALLDSWHQGIRENRPSLEPMREPWIQRALVDMLHAMTWRVIRMDEPNVFITGDNPVFFTDEIGLTHLDGELSFPISSQAALHASWIPGPAELMFVSGSEYVAQEINRRTVGAAERFLFSSKEYVDVDKMAQQPPPTLYPFPWW